MRVLIVSYLFDRQAEGICTGRLVRALLDSRIEVTLLTSGEADTSFAHPKLKVISVPAPDYPYFVLAALNRIYGTPGISVPWCRRIAKAATKLPRPDLIYGRSFPLDGPYSAKLIASQFNSPYWIHYSDPIPSPWLIEDYNSRIRREIRLSLRLSHTAQAITFTTREALAFQQRTLGMDLSEKAFVLHHVAPEPLKLPEKTGVDPEFVYIGSFYGRRSPRHLLSGFAKYLTTSPTARLTFVGSTADSIMPFAEELNIAGAIRLIPATKHVIPQMKEADVLIGVDSSFGAPVFMTTKLIEYLMVNRRVLMVTPEESPSSKLLLNFPSTTVLTKEDPEKISVAFAKAIALSPTEEDYQERFRLMDEFRAHSIGRTFIIQAAKHHIC